MPDVHFAADLFLLAAIDQNGTLPPTTGRSPEHSTLTRTRGDQPGAIGRKDHVEQGTAMPMSVNNS
jgi:hypothetical protein